MCLCHCSTLLILEGPEEWVSYLTDGFVGCLPLREGDKSVTPMNEIRKFNIMKVHLFQLFLIQR